MSTLTDIKNLEPSMLATVGVSQLCYLERRGMLIYMCVLLRVFWKAPCRLLCMPKTNLEHKLLCDPVVLPRMQWCGVDSYVYC